ncbi:MAG: hypothetical protein RLZZ401_2057 [Pseudomonadota bacterium]
MNNFINGEWLAGAGYAPNLNPSNLADVVGEYTQGDAGQVGATVSAATAAFSAWSTGSVQGRYSQEFFTVVKTAYSLA